MGMKVKHEPRLQRLIHFGKVVQRDSESCGVGL